MYEIPAVIQPRNNFRVSSTELILFSLRTVFGQVLKTKIDFTHILKAIERIRKKKKVRIKLSYL